jgi:hypothetical protein
LLKTVPPLAERFFILVHYLTFAAQLHLRFLFFGEGGQAKNFFRHCGDASNFINQFDLSDLFDIMTFNYGKNI